MTSRPALFFIAALLILSSSLAAIRHLQWRMADERSATRPRARQSLSRPAGRGGCRPPNLPRSLCPLSWQRRGWNQEAAFPEERPGAARGHRRRPPLVAGEREPGPGYAILGQAGRSSDLAGHLLCEVAQLRPTARTTARADFELVYPVSGTGPGGTGSAHPTVTRACFKNRVVTGHAFTGC